MEVFDLLQKYIPNIPVLVITILVIVYLFLQLVDNFNKVKEAILTVLDGTKFFDRILWGHIRRKYDKTLASEDFLQWQNKVLKKIYRPYIDATQDILVQQEWNNDIAKINFSQVEFGDEDTWDYESVTIQLPAVPYPFDDVCPKELLITKKDTNQTKYSDKIKKFKVWFYYHIVKRTIRYPKRIGYMLGTLELDNNWKITSYVGNYENNIKTSHVLEYELYRLFKKAEKEELSADELMKKLPIRNEIHHLYKDDMGQLLLSGKGRDSLLGVQMFVLVKNESGSYDALRIRRSMEVAAKPGFLQFIPSGGFEAINDCNDFDSQWDNYSLKKAIFRELLEECFGQDEDDKKSSGNSVSPDRIYHNSHIKGLIKLIKEGKAEMQLLGITESLVSLRHELSFILRVDDSDFADKNR